MFGQELNLATAWDPWRELSRLHNEVNRWFSGSSDPRLASVPAVNVWTNEDGVVLRALLPGFDQKDVEISVLGDSVTLSGKREKSGASKDDTCHRREREYGQFTRTLQLPFRLEADAAKATFKNGVLELVLPRANADRPKRIVVKAD